MSENSQIIARSSIFIDLLKLAEKIAGSSANVLISGESGTGKEVLARFIHEKSLRGNGPFVPLNCSAIPEQLLESELFGFARGAFTGALQHKAGLFEEAQGGSLFLDEIGDMNIHLQAKLLRVLQERKVKRVGENHYRSIDIRVIAATNRNLYEAVEAHHFREDLFFRLNVIPLELPPLRQRPEDILPLAEYFLQKFQKNHNFPIKNLSDDAKAFLKNHHWRGNVRELENMIERAVVLSSTEKIELIDFHICTELNHRNQQEFECFTGAPTLTLEELNQRYISHVLAYHQGAKEKSAKVLGIDRKTLYRWIHDKPQ
jgi:transcriptional regulator with PAS, ATPase and Fis domain